MLGVVGNVAIFVFTFAFSFKSANVIMLKCNILFYFYPLRLQIDEVYGVSVYTKAACTIIELKIHLSTLYHRFRNITQAVLHVWY